MAITEFVIPNFSQEADSIAAFSSAIAPFLNNLLDKSEPGTGPKQRVFGKVLLENGKDVSGDFRPCLGLEWEKAEDFYTLISSEGFKSFVALVKPHSLAPPNPQIYETDSGPSDVFASTLTEVWQVKIGEGSDEEAREAWKVFVDAVGGGKGIQGTSLNQPERLLIGVLGWESMEAREKILGSATVSEAKKGLDGLVWNTFVATFAQ
ncbi:hypothetical protein BKA65DRAFT_170467 [Rhexocercosporidium sp. MPI-PUGE-AT-0058]|nr:hypothetical protein BKA65DRAFT_170467 [Rhexocercosporidium sp. MPI-PUGE-AT-0058]